MLCASLMVCLYACSEVIDLNTELLGGQLVVYGRITNGTQGNVITISRTTSAGQQPTPVVGAAVAVSDGSGNTASYVDVGEGNYQLDHGGLTATPGQSYELSITLPDGSAYASVPEVMPEVSARDSLYAELREIERISDRGVTSTVQVVSIYTDTYITNPRSDLYLKWDVEEVYSFQQAVLPGHNFPFYSRKTCYITNELEQQRVLTYDGSELRASEIRGTLVVDRDIDDSFRGTHYFNLVQQSLTRGAHNFWSGIDQNTNRVGSIFDQPPGAIKSNLYNVNDPAERILGYFEVVATDTARLKITNRLIDRFFSDPCPVDPQVNFVPLLCYRCLERFFEPECLDCLVLKNSSHDRPSYFE